METSEKKRQYLKAYYEKHKEEIKQYKKAYREKHKEEINRKDRERHRRKKEIVQDINITTEIELLKAEKKTKLSNAKIEALQTTQRRLNYFANRMYDRKLIYDIAVKRTSLIRQAKTIKEVDEVTNPKYPNAKYGIEAEEIIWWGEISLVRPLTNDECDRYTTLVNKFYQK